MFQCNHHQQGAHYSSLAKLQLLNKNNELLGSVLPKLRHVVRLTEHHCKEQEIETLSIDQYILGAKFCRQRLKHGGTGIFVHESLAFTNICKNFVWSRT
jgi:hypothetical protein